MTLCLVIKFGFDSLSAFKFNWVTLDLSYQPLTSHCCAERRENHQLNCELHAENLSFVKELPRSAVPQAIKSRI